MITIELHDSFGNELNIDDVVVLHYPNPEVKYIGLLKFDKKDNRFILSDGSDGWNGFLNTAKSCEKVGTLKDCPSIIHELGRFENLSENDYEKIISKL